MKNKNKKGVIFTIAITIIFFLLLGVVSLSTGVIFAERISNYDLEAYCWINGMAQLVLSIGIIFIMKKVDIFDKRDFNLTGSGRGMFTGLVGIIFGIFMFLVNLIGNLSYIQIPNISYLLAGVFIAFTTGLFEEVLVRGFAYNNFLKYYGSSITGIKKSIIWSSVLFGVMHIVNLSGYDLASILTTASQIISAIIIGMYFALVYTKSKNLWAVVIIHALIDGATFVLYSILSTEAFRPDASETLSTLDTILQNFIVSLASMVPFLVAVIVKWRKLKFSFTGTEMD